MRKQYFWWIYLVTFLVLAIYGGYSVIYSVTHSQSIPTLAIIFLGIAGIMALLFLGLFVFFLIQRKRKPVEPETKIVEEVKVEEKSVEEKPIVKETSKPQKTNYSSSDEVEYSRPTSRYDSGSNTIYVKKVGYGPVLRVSGSQILDMRTNTYYTLEGRMLHQNGYGPVYEINGDRIRVAFGSYLYEISGSNINKVFGGLYASFSGNYLQTFDLKEKYEIDGSLSKSQKLAIAALLFGSY